MKIGTAREFWRAYQLGQGSADHTDFEVFAEIIQPLIDYASGASDEIRREELAHGETVDQRDRAEKWADKLAYAIGEHFGFDVGEHSNVNCPWEEALDAIPTPVSDSQECAHEYVDPTNQRVVSNGYEVCIHCGDLKAPAADSRESIADAARRVFGDWEFCEDGYMRRGAVLERYREADKQPMTEENQVPVSDSEADEIDAAVVDSLAHQIERERNVLMDILIENGIEVDLKEVIRRASSAATRQERD